MNNILLKELNPWKDLRFRSNEIPLKHLVAVMKDKSSESPLGLRKAKTQSNVWDLVMAANNGVIVCTYAFVWSWGSPLETGNFVPPNEEADPNLKRGRIQNKPSYLCGVSYAFDTVNDPEIYDILEDIEEWVSQFNDFNSAVKPPRDWQSKRDPASIGRLICTSNLFSRRNTFNCHRDGKPKKVPYKLHSWIQDYTSPKNPSWVPNPERALYIEIRDGKAKSLTDSQPPEFRKGDIVKMAFKISFVIGDDNWWVQLNPIMLARVGEITDYESIVGIKSHEVDEEVLTEGYGFLAQGDYDISLLEGDAISMLGKREPATGPGTQPKTPREPSPDWGPIAEDTDEKLTPVPSSPSPKKRGGKRPKRS